MTLLTISSGFQTGVNTLEFLVNNASLGYTGLRVENLRVGALPATSWAAVNAPVKVAGDRNVLTVPKPEAVEFFRLQK